MNIHNIKTERLCLEVITEEDFGFVQELVNSKGWLDFIGDRNINSKNDAIAYIKKLSATQNLAYWVIRLKETNTAIGIISFLKRAYLEHFDLGFALFPQFYGNGYAYEAAREVLLLITQSAEHTRVLATTVEGNIRSIKLLERLGFSFDKEIEVENEKLYVFTALITP